MPTNPNMVAIQTVTVGAGGAASIDFTSIPQTYTDLYVVLSVRSDRNFTNDSLGLKPNNSTSNRSGRTLQGSGSAASSTTTTGEIVYAALNGNTATASTFSNISVYCPNYTSSNYKSFSADGVMETNATGADMSINAWLWSDTSAITSLVFYPIVGSNFVQYSTATLYGVTSAGYGAKATGGIITQDANYYYHTFVASGTFTPTQSITADCLVIAGGGGSSASGGGAGGLLAHTSQSLTATGYTITVGGGGSGGVHQTSDANDGSNSQFGALTASVGGGGGRAGTGSTTTGRTGGSGGGGTALNTASTGAGGSATSSQGFAGGSGTASAGAGNAGGAGGGAGAVGGNSTYNSSAGNGGAGTNTYASWATATGTGISGYFAGGGGGQGGNSGSYLGTGGAGGGGAAALAGSAGTANTGGGAGAVYNPGNTGKAGGSGIVIVRYAK